MVHVGARKATAVHMYFMYVCVCVHRATCSTVDKVEKVEKVSLKQYGNTGGTRYTVCTPPSYTLVIHVLVNMSSMYTCSFEIDNINKLYNTLKVFLN